MRVPACLRLFGGPHPMGEKQNQPFQLSFNASLKVDFQGSRVTSDGGLLLVRELDERLGLEKLIEELSANACKPPPTDFARQLQFRGEDDIQNARLNGKMVFSELTHIAEL